MKLLNIIVTIFLIATASYQSGDNATCCQFEGNDGCNFLVVSWDGGDSGHQYVDCGDGYYTSQGPGTYGSCPGNEYSCWMPQEA
jgi:hypothetical protein